MSRVKRQRLTIDGFDQTTSRHGDLLALGNRGPTEIAETMELKGQRRCSLFVHSLPATATSESLTKFFSQGFPLKHATVVLDQTTKQSKGYGFVTFADVEDAQSARKSFDGTLFEGRKIMVEIAEPRHRHRQAGADGNATATKARATPTRQKFKIQGPRKLIVRNLPWTIKEPEHLAALFRGYGKVNHATIPKKKAGLSPGFGFVVLRRKNAEKALAGVNGKEIEGRIIAVDWAVDKSVWEDLQAVDRGMEGDNHMSSPNKIHQDGDSVKLEESSRTRVDDVPNSDMNTTSTMGSEYGQDISDGNQFADDDSSSERLDYNTNTLFVRNLPFNSTDETVKRHFLTFGSVRYARIVLDPTTERPKGTAFVCFHEKEDADACFQGAPKLRSFTGSARGGPSNFTKQSLLENESIDRSGQYTIEGRVLRLSRAVNRNEAIRFASASRDLRNARDKDRRRLYLLSEGTAQFDTTLYAQLSTYELKMRENSAKQRQSLIKSNPALHLSLTRLSVRNLPHGMTSKELKALAREAVVGFAKDVKAGLREQLSKEELLRGGDDMKKAEKARKAKRKGIVKQVKIVFEDRKGGKVTEDSGAGRSRGYGFIEYSSHRWALMGLRWLNGHTLGSSMSFSGLEGIERKKRLIVEFAMENAQVVGRRHEREAKARERSKTVSEGRDSARSTSLTSKTLNTHHLMVKTRRGTNKQQVSAVSSANLAGPSAILENNVKREGEHFKGPTDRQKIIGRKRMMRKSRSKVIST